MRLPKLESVIQIGGTSPSTRFAELAISGGGPQRRLAELARTLQFDEPINVEFTGSAWQGHPRGRRSAYNILGNAYFVGCRAGAGGGPRLHPEHLPLASAW
ncbi:MAG: hypothetical protein U1E17_07885 [Geminicoccaceae bacterium]